MKICTKCHVEKDEAEFYSRGGGRLCSHCKACVRGYNATSERCEERRKYRASPKGREAKRKRNTSPEGREANRKYAATPARREAKRKTRRTPKAQEAQRKRNTSHEGREERRKYRASPKGRETQREHNATPERHMANALRVRLHGAIRNGAKAGSAVRDLGCSVEEFKAHIAAQFVGTMTWENYGSKGFHLDHKIPLTAFDLSDREQLLAACHYSNYQPLFAAENIRKHNRIEYRHVFDLLTIPPCVQNWLDAEADKFPHLDFTDPCAALDIAA